MEQQSRQERYEMIDRLKENPQEFETNPIAQNDRLAALTIVEQDGSYLQYAERHIRDDKEVVMAAVENWGPAIMYATPKMKNDPEVALEAVTRNGKMLAYVSDNMRNSPRIVKAALKQTKDAERYIGPKLQARMAEIEGDLTPLEKITEIRKQNWREYQKQLQLDKQRENAQTREQGSMPISISRTSGKGMER